MSEQLIASRTADARVLKAELALGPASVAALPGQEAGGEGVVDWFRGVHGGLWVGGRATLTDRRLHFEANPLHKMVHTGPSEVDVDLRHVLDVTVRAGVLADTVQVLLPGAVLQLRGWGARAFAQQVSDAVRSAHGPTM